MDDPAAEVTEVIDKAFAAALYADVYGGGNGANGGGGDGLDTGASLLAAAPDADAELWRRGEELVRRAWERGWQPADVIRMVGRAQDDVAHGVDRAHLTRLAAELITTETRRYGDTLPPRWHGQLSELTLQYGDAASRPEGSSTAGTKPGGSSSGGSSAGGSSSGGPKRGGSSPSGARADRSSSGGAKAGRSSRPLAAPKLDRFSQATVTLALYRLLLRLPVIEPVGPAPGAPLHAPPPPGHEEPRILTRIRALLAKAEATGFPEEAEALTAKAQELMARHTIDEALLASRTHAKDTPGACRIGVDAPYETAKAILLDAVATANRCRAVWNEAYGFSTVVGFETDLEVVELLHTSLLVQGTAAMTKAEAGQRAGGRKRTKTFRQAFLLAYANRLGARLAAAAEDVTVGSPDAGELLPVLAARDVAVTSRAERMFPRTTTTRVRGAVDREGWEQGAAAADAAAVGPGRARLP
ncbi:DUF2786 domain-containing protein [Streptomyces sp. NPDC050439]|uniref:DUF2786 domain-containing protein n=1 Tax=unclassified Streptomyces TaxID=2593676 RepID=UPI003437297B